MKLTREKQVFLPLLRKGGVRGDFYKSLKSS